MVLSGGVSNMIIISTIGFDERPVLRALSETGFRGIEKIILIRPLDDDPRAVKAVSEIKKIASIAGLRDEDIVSYRVDPHHFWESVSLIYDLLENTMSGANSVVLLLGGGLRALIIETYTAFLLLSCSKRTKCIVRIDLETGDSTIVVPGAEIIVNTVLTPLEKRVLETIKEKPGASLTIISDVLVKPASTIYRVLKRLVDKGLVEKRNRKYFLTSSGKIALKIMARNKG
ncbi:MAG: CRISPR locus-related DNA-binding protein [Crenarchaeota archaeon]|nr:CRISPR locus-related DNA-binding protein [Thermoproteota archaeon]